MWFKSSREATAPLSEAQAEQTRALVESVRGLRYLLAGPLLEAKNRKLRKLRELVEQTNRKLSRLAEGTGRVCETGCTHCCCQLFKVTAAEVEVISWHLIAHPPLLEAFAASYARRLAGPQDQVQEMYRRYTTGSNDEQREVTFEYFARKLPCAFLDRDGGCTIYEVRPQICAAFVSTSKAECAKSPIGFMSHEMGLIFRETGEKLGVASKKLELHADISTMVYRHLQDLVAKGGKALLI